MWTAAHAVRRVATTVMGSADRQRSGDASEVGANQDLTSC